MNNAKQAGVDWPTVLKMLAGGAFVGGGLGAGTSYLNQLGNLKEDAAPQEDDKNTLYINLPGQQAPVAPIKGRKKLASDENSALTYALGGTGALAGTYVAYNAIRNAYQNSRKRQLQKELDQAHQVYMGKLDDSASLEKGASQFPTLSKGVGLAYMALLATGVGSGVIANKILNKQMPALEEPSRFEPKRIVVRTKPNPDGDEEKEASAKSDVEIGPDEIEGLLRQHLAGKSASISGFNDLVCAAAQGRCQEIQEQIGDLDTLFALVKGASLSPADKWKQDLAVTWLATDPEIAGALAPMLAAEYADTCPGLFKMAAYTEPRVRKALAGLVKAAVVETRKAVHRAVWSQVKMADTVFDRFIPEPAENLLLANSLKEMLTDPEEKAQQPVSPALSDSPKVTPPTANMVADDDASARFLMQHKGNLEKALAQAA